ncbi:hypothetical protein KAK06_06060 [Ideonella sp. 4Y11]|uniref:MxaA protein n=1 Tax=Ideonella aquatica TaxID=2824119 RepID=A0A940YIL2_9BURK|nr:hypothetical protein [Ideonella aquatica]MBQ0958519.1 hypothetical protein [Ideonella aquatica]
MALGCGAALAAVEVPTLATTEPVAYGHRLGDVVERQLHLRLPPGARLETSSLPVPGTQGALELRSLQHQGAADAAEQTLRLRYQVMRSPEQPAVSELPTLTLRVTLPAGATRREAVLRAEAWPLVVGPLTPPQPPERAGLGPLQPDRPLPQQPIAPIRQQAQLGAALTLLAAAWLGWRHLGRPLWWRRQRPFARAWRALRQEASLDAQLRRLHRAIDEDAGRAVQAEDLDAWLAERPAYAPLATELRAVLDASACHFFAPAAGRDDAALATRLRTLLRQLAQAEAHA